MTDRLVPDTDCEGVVHSGGMASMNLSWCRDLLVVRATLIIDDGGVIVFENIV